MPIWKYIDTCYKYGCIFVWIIPWMLVCWTAKTWCFMGLYRDAPFVMVICIAPESNTHVNLVTTSGRHALIVPEIQQGASNHLIFLRKLEALWFPMCALFLPLILCFHWNHCSLSVLSELIRVLGNLASSTDPKFWHQFDLFSVKKNKPKFQAWVPVCS